MHGRVAMVAFVGYVLGEDLAPVVSGGAIHGPAKDHLMLIPGPLLALLTLLVGIAETFRVRKGFVENGGGDLEWHYYPGDLGWDPLNLKPKASKDFDDLQTKELNHGRLAMIAITGICAQEIVTQQTLRTTLTTLFSS